MHIYRHTYRHNLLDVAYCYIYIISVLEYYVCVCVCVCIPNYTIAYGVRI
jgi:hypothetical protein